MILKIDKKTTGYDAAEKVIFEKYGVMGESKVVQLRTKYKFDKDWTDITTLLLNDGTWSEPDWIWEYDWWEGEEDVDLVAVAPVSRIDISEDFAIEGEHENSDD